MTGCLLNEPLKKKTEANEQQKFLAWLRSFSNNEVDDSAIKQ